MRRLFFLFPLLLIAGCNAGRGEEVPVGSMAPSVKIDTLLSPATATSLASRRGKVVLLDFWATWCGPCKAVTPVLEKIYEKYKGQGLEAMAISNEAREIVAINEQKRPHAIPVYLDSSEDASRAFGVVSLPTIMVIGRDGRIAYRITGVPPEPEAEIAAAVEAALGKP